MPRIVLIDIVSVMRTALGQLFERELGYEVIAEFDDSGDALDVLQSEHPDLVVTNLVGAQPTGPQRVARIRQHAPDAKILVCSYVVPLLVPLQDVINAGANGYVARTGTAAEFLEGAREVMAGNLSIDRGTATLLIEAQQKRAALGLKLREEEVLALITVGLSNAQIAERLNLSVHTVRQMVSTILAKLGVPDRAGANAYVRTNGIISLGSEHIVLLDRRTEHQQEAAFSIPSPTDGPTSVDP